MQTTGIFARTPERHTTMPSIVGCSLPPFVSSPLWFFCTILLLSFTYIRQLTALSYDASLQGAAHFAKPIVDGHSTDFAQVTPAIKLSQTRFNGAIRDNADGSLFFHWDIDGPRYTTSSGADWDEVDESWKNLLHGRYVQLTPTEIDWLNSDPLLPDLLAINSSNVAKGIYGGPDMLHSLHCLNGLRQALHMDRYADDMWMTEPMRIMHIDHCIEQLRQAILCHGDMTPVTIKPVVRNGTVRIWLGETERPHTCRNGMELREWWWQRGERTGRIPF